jgi:colicin import membrane protein
VDNSQIAMLEAARDRLARENVRLNDELTLLARNHEKGRAALDRLSALEDSTVRLEADLSVSRRKQEDQSREFTRLRSQLESQLASAHSHLRQVEDELSTTRTTLGRFEAQLHEKERALSAEASVASSLRADLRDAAHDLKVAREDALRQKEEDATRIAQVSSLLADAKKQRLVLLDLNEKCLREKESADADKRRVEDTLIHTQHCTAAEIKLLETEVNRLTAQIEQSKAGNHEKEVELAQRVQALESDLRQRDAQLQVQERELTSRHSAVDAAIAATRSAIQEQLSKEVYRREVAESQVTELSARVDDLHHQLNVVSERLRSVGSVAKREAEQTSAEELLRLRQRLAAGERALQDALDENAALKARIDVEASARIESDEAATKAKCRFANLKDAMDRLLASDDQLAEENETLHRKVVDLESALDRAAAEHRGALTQAALFQELEIENQRLQAQASRIHAERNDLSREIDRLQQQLKQSRRADGAPQPQNSPAAHVSIARSSRNDFVF